MTPNVCVRGNEEHAATIIKFFERVGCKRNNCACENSDYFYFVNNIGYVNCSESQPQGKRLVTLEEAIEVINGTVVYDEIPKFPRIMWCWDDKPEKAVRDTVHGHISTLNFGWITSNLKWRNASDTDPRPRPELTIEEAETKFNIKIKR